MTISSGPYRDRAKPNEEHPLAPLAGQYEVVLDSVDDRVARFYAKPGPHRISISLWGFEGLSLAQKQAIAAQLLSGKLRVTIEVVE